MSSFQIVKQNNSLQNLINYYLQRSFEDTKHYIDYLKDKNVVIVGPSASLKGKNLGRYFDSFDVVVRLNRGLVKRGRLSDIGTRTDILYNNMTFEEENSMIRRNLKKKGIKYLVSAYPLIPPFDQDIIKSLTGLKGDIPFIIPPVDFYMGLVGNLNMTRPFTGLCAIMDLLRYPINSLTVYGVDFYLTGGYMPGYHTGKKIQNIAENNIHSASKHHEFLRKYIFTMPKLNFDPDIVKLLFYNENNWSLWIRNNPNLFYYKMKDWINYWDNIYCYKNLSEYLKINPSNINSTKDCHLIFIDILNETSLNLSSIKSIEKNKSNVWIWIDYVGLDFSRTLDPLNYLSFNQTKLINKYSLNILKKNLTDFEIFIASLFVFKEKTNIFINSNQLNNSSWLGYLNSINLIYLYN